MGTHFETSINTLQRKMRVKMVKREQEVFMANHCTGNKLKTNCLMCGSYYKPSPNIRSKNNLFCYLLINLCWMEKCHPELEVWMKNRTPQPEFNSIACAASTYADLHTMEDFDRRKENLACIYEKPEMSVINSTDKQYVIEHGQDIPIVSYELLVGSNAKLDTESCKRKTSLPHCETPGSLDVQPDSSVTIESSNMKITLWTVTFITLCVPCIACAVLLRRRRTQRRNEEENNAADTEAKLIEEEKLNTNT